MKIVCPACGEFIQGGQIDLQRGLGVCRPCGEVVALPAVVRLDDEGTAELKGDGNALLVAHKVAALPLWAYRPRDWDYAERRVRGGPSTFIGLREERGTALVFITASLAWLALLFVWYNFIRSPDLGMKVFGPARFLPFALHLLTGLYVLYGSICLLTNTVGLTVGPAHFRLASAPLPQPGVVEAAVRDIRTFVDRETRVSRLPDRWFRPRVAWTVALLLKDGTEHELPLYLPTRDRARYLALRLNRAVDELRAAAQPVRPAVKVEAHKPPADPDEEEE